MKPIVKAILAVCAIAIAPVALADKTVKFNVPVKLEKLDPTVKSAFVHCGIWGPGNWSVIDSSPVVMVTNGAYQGTLSVDVTVAEADLGKAKTWSCYLRLKQNTNPSPGVGGFGVNVAGQPWTNVAPGAVDTVSGSF